VDAVLERRAVLDQVEAKAGELALLSDPRIGQPDRRHQVAVGERRQDQRVDLAVLQAKGARPLTFWASAISTDQPSCSRVSWAILAPVIDSMTAQTGWRWTSPIRLANLLSDSTSGATASWSRCSPRSESRQTSSLRRLRSNPACNIEVGPPLSSLLGERVERCTEVVFV
jgi:hypothetical protein